MSDEAKRLAEQKAREEREVGLVAIRLVELRFEPIKGNFDTDHLKTVHAYIFQDLPHHRPGITRNDTAESWIKHRALEGRPVVYDVPYVSQGVEARITDILGQFGGVDSLKGLTLDTAAGRLAGLYGDLDHAHGFYEGNSRTLREFTRELASEAGFTLDWVWEHDPFGNGAPTSTFTENLRFPGQYHDSGTGFAYNYFRDYDPATGRYIESDPIGLAGGINTYGYVQSNPLMHVDRQGLADEVRENWPYPPPSLATEPVEAFLELIEGLEQVELPGGQVCGATQIGAGMTHAFKYGYEATEYVDLSYAYDESSPFQLPWYAWQTPDQWIRSQSSNVTVPVFDQTQPIRINPYAWQSPDAWAAPHQ